MARKAPAFQFYADDFLAGTLDMSPSEVGVYVRLLCFQWSKGRVTVREANACGGTRDDIDYVLRNKFVEQGDGTWINERLEHVRIVSEERTLNGSKGGSKTQANAQAKLEANGVAKPQADPEANESAKLNPPTPSPSPTPSPTPDPEDSLSGEAERNAYSEDFETFWSVFPKQRRTKKGEAYRRWKTLSKTVEPSTLIEAASEYAGSDQGRSEFAVMPSVWLNGRMWEDDREAWKRNGQRTSTTKQDDGLNYGQRALKRLRDD